MSLQLEHLVLFSELPDLDRMWSTTTLEASMSFGGNMSESWTVTDVTLSFNGNPPYTAMGLADLDQAVYKRVYLSLYIYIGVVSVLCLVASVIVISVILSTKRMKTRKYTFLINMLVNDCLASCTIVAYVLFAIFADIHTAAKWVSF